MRAYLVLFTVLAALLGLYPQPANAIDADPAYQRNFNACRFGTYGCDLSLVRSDDLPAVKEAAYQRNFNACRFGTYGCDIAALRPADLSTVEQANYQRNYNACRFGTYGCDIGLVRTDDLPAIQEATYQRNYNACRFGFSGCDISRVRADDVSSLGQATNQPKGITTSTLSAVGAQPSFGCAENGSCYGDISATTGTPKTVSVRGYYRSNGTYVRGHYRSAPRR